nr:PREDICTED: segmentation protein cap'n'collar isoform X3 [Bemisia tabaci]
MCSEWSKNPLFSSAALIVYWNTIKIIEEPPSGDYELVSKKERLKAVESEEREEEEKARKEVKKEHLLEEEVEIKEEPEEEQEGESEAEAYPLLAGAPDAEEPLAFSNEFALEETLQLVSLDDVSPSANPVAQESFKKDVSDEAKGKACSVTRKEKDFFEECHEELELFFDMIQTPQFHHNPRPFSGRMSYMRPMNMEQQQRWQDLANFLSLPESPYQHHAAAAAAAYHPAHPAHPGHHPAHPPHGGHPGHPHGHPANGSYHHHHHHHHNMTSALPQPDRSVLLHNATLAPPVGDLNSSCPYPTIGANSNFGSAVATSMNLTNSSEPIGNENSGASFKMEPSSHDMMYYQNSSSEINQTDGFLSSILNDEDLQLMDMAMNEEMYSMRMLEGAVGGNNSMMGCHTTGERAGTDSDSAVSSMGSERVPSLSSDNEWMETNSDSGHNIADHYNSDYRKYRCYDYQYSTRSHTASENSTSSRLPVAPQKKYHMYGKRYLQEQASGAGPDLSAATPEEAAIAPLKYEPSTSTAMPVPSMLPAHDMKAQQESKYSCSIEFACNNLLNSRIGDHVNHNHTYHLPPENIGTMQRPYLKDKQKCRRNDEHQQQMTRDEKRARALNIPISVMDIINLPMDEFNERLSKYDLSESQLSLIRDIRRRGKNKVAAQNCRKRKLDQIICLADEVQQMRDRKNRAEKERHYLITERHRIKELFNQLYRHIFQNLRDPDGNPYSSYEYSLQMAADGSIVLMPRDNGTISPLVDPSEYSHLRGRHKDPPHKQ